MKTCKTRASVALILTLEENVASLDPWWHPSTPISLIHFHSGSEVWDGESRYRLYLNSSQLLYAFKFKSSLLHKYSYVFFALLFQVNWVSSSSTPPFFSSRGRHFDRDLTVSSWIWGLGFVMGGEGAVLYLCQRLRPVSGSLFPGNQGHILCWVRAGWWHTWFSRSWCVEMQGAPQGCLCWA